jgi:type II secretory pathway pseudopilin PulG
MKPELQVVWITSAVAIVSLAATILVQLVLRFLDKRAERKKEVMQLRREALHNALRVIDHVYSNVGFGQTAPAKPHAWDIAEAWEAWNMMILYCANPRAATDAFGAAVGLGSDGVPASRPFGPADLVRFRKVVATELETPGDSSVDPARVWIAKLPGTGPAT